MEKQYTMKKREYEPGIVLQKRVTFYVKAMLPDDDKSPRPTVDPAKKKSAKNG
jgi:hypothetical protein